MRGYVVQGGRVQCKASGEVRAAVSTARVLHRAAQHGLVASGSRVWDADPQGSWGPLLAASSTLTSVGSAVRSLGGLRLGNLHTAARG